MFKLLAYDIISTSERITASEVYFKRFYFHIIFLHVYQEAWEWHLSDEVCRNCAFGNVQAIKCKLGNYSRSYGNILITNSQNYELCYIYMEK